MDAEVTKVTKQVDGKDVADVLKLKPNLVVDGGDWKVGGKAEYCNKLTLLQAMCWYKPCKAAQVTVQLDV